MKENDIRTLLKGADSSLSPTRELNNAALAKMATYSKKDKLADKIIENPTVRRKGKTLLILAATVACFAMLVGAGVQIFEQVFFVPGRGVFFDDFSDAKVLEYATPIGSEYIEGASLVPNGDGTFDLELITSVSPRKIGETRKISVTFPDGTTMESHVAMTAHFKNVPSSDRFTVTLDTGASVELSLIPINRSEYAVYEYPVDRGVTFVCFPISKGSRVVTYTTSYDSSNEPENLRALADAANGGSATIDLRNIEFTDANGNTYETHSERGQGVGGIREDGFLGGARMLVLDRRPEAEIVKITVNEMTLYFGGNSELSKKLTFTLPEIGETVEVNTPFFDGYGIRDYASTLTFHPADEKRQVPTAIFYLYDSKKMEGVDYAGIPDVRYVLTDPITGNAYKNTGITINRIDTDVLDEQQIGVSYLRGGDDDDRELEPGNLIEIYASGIAVPISGEWIIDFTDTVE